MGQRNAAVSESAVTITNELLDEIERLEAATGGHARALTGEIRRLREERNEAVALVREAFEGVVFPDYTYEPDDWMEWRDRAEKLTGPL